MRKRAADKAESAGADAGAPVVQGCLLKQSTGLVKRWQERFYVLEPPFLKYYTSGERKVMRAALDTTDGNLRIPLRYGSGATFMQGGGRQFDRQDESIGVAMTATAAAWRLQPKVCLQVVTPQHGGGSTVALMMKRHWEHGIAWSTAHCLRQRKRVLRAARFDAVNVIHASI